MNTYTHVGAGMAKSPILWLPCELLVHMASYLYSEDLFSFRLACRCIERCLFVNFREEFFSDRRFMVTQRLTCLVEISKHYALAECLSKVTIGLDRLYSSDALPQNASTSPIAQADDARIDMDGLEELATEQNWLTSSGKLQLLLGEAFRNLPRLAELSVRDSNVARRSSRPGASQVLVSYGVAHIFRETGIDLRAERARLRTEDSFPDVVLSTALLAVGASGKALGALTADIENVFMGFSSSAFAMPRFAVDAMKPVFAGMTSLELTVAFAHTLGGVGSMTRGFLRWQPHRLFALLEQMPNLACLRVKSRGEGFLPEGIIGWLAGLVDVENGERPEASTLYGPLLRSGPARLAATPPSLRFRNLGELELEHMLAPQASIVKVLRCVAPSLRRLHLSAVGVRVQRGDQELDNNPEYPNAWTSLFRFMSRAMSLSQIRVRALGHDPLACQSGSRHQVAFRRSPAGEQSVLPNGMINGWLCAGTPREMRRFLLEVAENTIIVCRQCQQRNPGYFSFEDIVHQE
ncbi:hypothetical protein GGS23DRAFT_614014 [Durotheca rogersii]|uniref:uncharacterized protein n=1 Tax=Durotheca rogersii TaxID=419775 RepID=UPI0022208238|nr:uncharacterized protein GGS23DRAFT_614014 [Durotheca rogersii]KAI5860438.1 hypothetical protein GGS23DRAFT_614014 [Durotheca rogersii]